MEIIKDESKLYEENTKQGKKIAICSLRIDMELNPEQAIKEHEWIVNKIKGSVIAYQERKLNVDAENKSKDLPEHKTCPITNVPVDGVLDSKTAIELGIISKYDRRVMKSDTKTLSNPFLYHDYNKFYCTAKYKTKIKYNRGQDLVEIPKKHQLVTIIL